MDESLSGKSVSHVWIEENETIHKRKGLRFYYPEEDVRHAVLKLKKKIKDNSDGNCWASWEVAEIIDKIFGSSLTQNSQANKQRPKNPDTLRGNNSPKDKFESMPQFITKHSGMAGISDKPADRKKTEPVSHTIDSAPIFQKAREFLEEQKAKDSAPTQNGSADICALCGYPKKEHYHLKDGIFCPLYEKRINLYENKFTPIKQQNKRGMK